MAIMSFAEYARYRGVSNQAVSAAIKKGKVPTSVDPVSGKRVIDSDVADMEWAANILPANYSRKLVKEPAPPKDAVQKPVRSASVDTGRPTIPTLVESRAIREAFNARITKLDYEVRVGKLVSSSEVEKSAFEMARIVRDAILNVPDRIANELAAEADPHRVHVRMSEELIKALESLQA